MSLKPARSADDSNYSALRGSDNGHPSAQRLRDYHQGRLSEAEEDQLQEHFVVCGECRQAMLELARFVDEVSQGARWDPEELVQEWQKVREALRRDNDVEAGLAVRNS